MFVHTGHNSTEFTEGLSKSSRKRKECLRLNFDGKRPTYEKILSSNSFRVEVCQYIMYIRSGFVPGYVSKARIKQGEYVLSSQYIHTYCTCMYVHGGRSDLYLQYLLLRTVSTVVVVDYSLRKPCVEERRTKKNTNKRNIYRMHVGSLALNKSFLVD